MSSGAGYRLLVSHALTATAMSMPWPSLLAQVWSTTHSDSWLGLAGAARMLPYVVLSTAAGILADRVRRTTVLRWSAGIRAVLLLACAAAVHADRLGAAVLLAVLTVAAGTPAYPAAVAAMPNLGGSRSDRLTSLLVTVEVTGFVVGPALGGLLLGLGEGGGSVSLGGVLAVLALPLLRGLDSGRTAAEPEAVGRGRLRTVLGCPPVRLAILMVALINFTDAAASVGLLSLSHEHWGTGDRGFGVATAALGFGSLAAPVIGLLVRLRGSLLLSGGGLTLAGVAPSLVLAAPPLALLGAAGTVVECVGTNILQTSVPDHVRAFSFGLMDSVMVLAGALGALLARHITAAVGPVATFVGLGVPLCGSVLFVVWLQPRSRANTLRRADVVRAVGGNQE